MSGLDKMKSRIFEEAEQSAAELLDQVKKPGRMQNISV